MQQLGQSLLLLLGSIVKNDIYILICALFTLVAFCLTMALAQDIEKEKKDWEQKSNQKFSGYLNIKLRRRYTLFLTLTSLFPLFGMLGTVFGLLGLDLATGDMENIRANFFIALTSTAWGIIFSVAFKVLNAFFSDYIEDQIEKAAGFTKGTLKNTSKK